MKLNCKPGDLAVVIKGENCGTLVDVICQHPIYGHGVWTVIPYGSGTCNFGTFEPGVEVGCFDEKLRPIRDSDGEDETLTWDGKPEKKEKETT